MAAAPHLPRRRRRAAAVIGAALALASIGLAACGGDDEEPPVAVTAPGEPVVVIRGYAFSPASITVAAGTEVVWLNEDRHDHTVTFEDDGVEHQLPPGGEFTRRFEEPGTYGYHCSIHETMTARVVVTD